MEYTQFIQLSPLKQKEEYERLALGFSKSVYTKAVKDKEAAHKKAVNAKLKK